MADALDVASDLEERFRQRSERIARSKAASIPKGEPGECEECGETFTRLVEGFCGRCRDELGVK